MEAVFLCVGVEETAEQVLILSLNECRDVHPVAGAHVEPVR
jgi:hypothetical protein